jgi:hypothetical protein
VIFHAVQHNRQKPGGNNRNYDDDDGDGIENRINFIYVSIASIVVEMQALFWFILLVDQ